MIRFLMGQSGRTLRFHPLRLRSRPGVAPGYGLARSGQMPVGGYGSHRLLSLSVATRPPAPRRPRPSPSVRAKR